MATFTVGRKRLNNSQKNVSQNKRKEADFLFISGCALICVTLFLTIFRTSADVGNEAAVPVMSSGVIEETVEELAHPDKDTSSEIEKWSVYDYIGHMIADLLFGE